MSLPDLTVSAIHNHADALVVDETRLEAYEGGELRMVHHNQFHRCNAGARPLPLILGDISALIAGGDR